MNVAVSLGDKAKEPGGEEVEEEEVKDFLDVDLYSRYASSKGVILLASSLIGMITPFTDTIYLPALLSVGSDLDANASQVSSTVSIYLAAAACGQLIWGSCTDRYGRLSVLYSCMLMYEAMTIACVFSTSINMLIVLRALEGLVVAGTIVPSTAIIADVFPPEERGAANGLFFIPVLVGPIVAPILGGFLALTYTWRACFVFLAAMTVPIAVFSFVAIPESHPYFYRNKSTDRDGKQQVARGPPPDFVSPLAALSFLVDSELSPYYLSIGTTFAGMFTSLTTLPLYLALPPYSLDPGTIGLCYIPVGVAMMLGSQIGGKLADISSVRFAYALGDGRMTYLLFFLWLNVPGLIGFGYSLQNGASLGLVLFCHCVLGLGQAALMPSTMSYLAIARPSSAGGVGSVMIFLCFASSALAISLSVIISDAIGIGSFFLLSGLSVCGGGVITTFLNLSRLQSAAATAPFTIPTTELASPSASASASASA